jgi:ADP-ribose pyrophosphatase
MSIEPLEPWQTVDRRLVIEHSPWVTVWEEQIRLPDGRLIENWLTFDMPDVAVIVALTDDEHIVVERSYRHGPRRVTLSLPAGHVEPGEEALAAAKRELLEETGYAADQWDALGGFTRDSNQGCGRVFLYLARRARSVTEPDTEDLEEIRVELMPLTELLVSVRRGDFAGLTSAAAIGLAMTALRDSPVPGHRSGRFGKLPP